MAGRGWLPASAQRLRPRSRPRPDAGCTGRARRGRARPRGRARSPAGRRRQARRPASQAVVPALRDRPAPRAGRADCRSGPGRSWRSTPGSRPKRSSHSSRWSRSRARTAAWSRTAQASSAAMAPAMLSLPTFMPRPMPPVLQEGGAHQILAPGDDAGGRAAQELVGAVDDDVGARGEKALEIVFGGDVDDHRHAAGVADRGELGERDLAVTARRGARPRRAPRRCAP